MPLKCALRQDCYFSHKMLAPLKRVNRHYYMTLLWTVSLNHVMIVNN
jgi:hypothetical protein